MASSFFDGFFESQKMSARPRISGAVLLIETSESLGPGSDSTVTPGFRTADFATCITFQLYLRTRHTIRPHEEALRPYVRGSRPARLGAERAGKDRQGHSVEDPPRSDGEVSDHAHHALPHRCVWAAPDRLTELE